uniref:Uncharacterized protein n=1 Tax=Arundo donax TaxID=35708 RepID=A0A0A9HEX6_ARUDO
MDQTMEEVVTASEKRICPQRLVPVGCCRDDEMVLAL